MNEWIVGVLSYVCLILGLSRMYYLSWKQTLVVGLLPVGWPVALVWFGIRAIRIRRCTPPEASTGAAPGPTSSGV